MKLKITGLFLGLFLILHAPDMHAFTFNDISSWLSNTFQSARSYFSQQKSPQFIARLKSLFSTQQPAAVLQPAFPVESTITPAPAAEATSVAVPPSETVVPPTQESYVQPQKAQLLKSEDLFKSDSLDFALEIGSTSGFDNPGARAYFYLERESNPKDFMAMFIYDLNSYLTSQRDISQKNIIKLAIDVEDIRNASLKERQRMYQDIIKLIGRLYANRAVYNLEYKVKSLFSIPANLPTKKYLNFTNNVKNALHNMLKNPTLYNKQELNVLEAIRDWLIKPEPQHVIDTMIHYPKEKEPALSGITNTSPDEFFTSDMLYTLEQKRKEGALLVLRNQDTHYALNYLLDFLNVKLLPSEHYGLMRYIKGWSRPEYVKTQNPNFYTDFIKEIGQAYMNAQAYHRKILDNKLLYIFGGTTDYEKNLSHNLQQALQDLLALSNNNPDLEKHHQVLQHIQQVAQASFGRDYAGNHQPAARL